MTGDPEGAEGATVEESLAGPLPTATRCIRPGFRRFVNLRFLLMSASVVVGFGSRHRLDRCSLNEQRPQGLLILSREMEIHAVLVSNSVSLTQ